MAHRTTDSDYSNTTQEAYSVHEICKEWDGRKVWVMIDDMWRQGTVLACGPVGPSSPSWNFIVQSKFDGHRYVVICTPTENGDFDNIEATEHIDIPAASVTNVHISYETLPAQSPLVDLGVHKCPIHPFVAEYIKRLLFQLEMQSGDGHMKALVAADAENSRLRMDLETSNNAYITQSANYDKYIAEILEEVKTLNDHNVALAQAASGNAVARDFQALIANLQTENRRLTSELRDLRAAVEDSKKAKAPTFEELERLHAELARLRESKGDLAGTAPHDISANKNINDALIRDARVYGKRLLELSHRLLKFEGKAVETGRPSFDYNSSSDTTRMFNKIAEESCRLEEKVVKLESSLKINPQTGAGSNAPLQGSFAEQIVQLRQLLIQIQARVDTMTGTVDRNSQAYSRVAELEKDKNDLLKLVSMAEEEREATHAYLDKTVQPVLDENDELRGLLHAKEAELKTAEAASKSKGLFW
jgi:hypothetical protein